MVDASLSRILVVAAVAMLAACASELDDQTDTSDEAVVQQTAAGGVEKVAVCHIPSGDSESASTIEVGAPAVDAHLAHGDYLGACVDCPANCDAIAAEVGLFCEAAVGWFPGLPPDFCETSVALVGDACSGLCPAFDPDSCRDFCAEVTDASFAGCVDVMGDPHLCSLGAGSVHDNCLSIFECPPPPPPCDQQCLEDANAMFDACVTDPPRDLICPDSLDPLGQTCLVDAQGYLNDCLFDPIDGCFPPADDCATDCSVSANDAFLSCVDEPVCGDPNDCVAEADRSAADCYDGCCVSDCIRYECEPACGGDPVCLDDCAVTHCEVLCSPPPCEFVCPSGECVPDPSFCTDPACEDGCFAEFDICLESGADPSECEFFLDDCLYGCAPPPPCDFVCPDGACVPDPSFCEPCEFVCPTGECAPGPEFCPDPTCEDGCFLDHIACLESGADPFECDMALDDCLFGCAPPPPPCDFICPDGTCVPDPAFCPEPTCEDACFVEFDACLSSGADPRECERLMDICIFECEPPPPPCDFVCPDGTCVPDPSFCEPCEFVCPTGECAPGPEFCPDPTCEDGCFLDHIACLESGADPFECDMALDDCLFGCAPPPPPCDFICPDGTCVPDPAFCPEPTCEDACFVEFDACLSSGADPRECERLMDICIFECEPPPPPCDFVCPDGTCVSDPGLCESCAFICPTGECAPGPEFCPAETCEDACVLDHIACLESGADPFGCDRAFEDCMAGCEPPPPPCDFVCPDGTCVPDPAYCDPGGCAGFMCPDGACVDDPAACECDPAFEVRDCSGFCFPAELIGNGICDPPLDCVDFDFDGGDCAIP